MRSDDFADLHALEESFWWFAGMRDVTAALLDPLLAGKEDATILDAGCGTGGNLAWLERYGRGRIVGIDVAAAALEFSRSRGHRALAGASATDLPFTDAAFDLVTSFDVLVQIPGEGADERALREMHRVLRPGGIAFVRAAAYPWMRSGHDLALGSVRRYTLRGLAAEMERAGFQVLRATYANSALLPGAALHRMVLKPLRLAGAGSDVKPLPRALRPLNRALAGVLRAEARLIRRGVSLPAGLSTICVARRPLR